MTRFFIPQDQFHADQTVTLYGEDARHLTRVLRKQPGAEITVLNGKGAEYRARITDVGDDRVTAVILEATQRLTESRVRINLVQGLPKGEKFEWILQKNTEIGVARFQPVLTERSTVKLDPAARAKKLDRWRKIVREAAEQSGRQLTPEIEPVRDWRELAAALRPGLILIPWEGEREQPIKRVLASRPEIPDEITVLIGPEGGFAVDEVEAARRWGAIPVTLGPRILRTETAGLAVATIILYQYGEMGG
jgi:16S rRNA (uracil1498-N3)-methyltransferase